MYALNLNNICCSTFLWCSNTYLHGKNLKELESAFVFFFWGHHAAGTIEDGIRQILEFHVLNYFLARCEPFPFTKIKKKKKDLIALLVVPFLNCCLMKSPRYRIALTPPGRLEHSWGPMSAHRTGLFQRTICQSCWGLHAVGSSRGSVLVKREEQRDGRYYSN